MTSALDIGIEAELRAELRQLHMEIARLNIKEAKVSAALKHLKGLTGSCAQTRPGWPIHRRITGEEPLH